MISLLLDLPNELLLEVLSHLDDNDINSLCGFDQIRDRVGSQFAVISNESDGVNFFMNFPRRIEQNKYTGELRYLSRVIIVLKNTTRSRAPASFLLQEFPADTHIHLFESTENSSTYSLHGDWRPVLENPRTRSVTIHHRHPVHLFGLNLTETMHFVNVKALSFENCKALSKGRTFLVDCPGLSELALIDVIQPMAAINRNSPDFESLELVGITDVSVWKGDSFPYLRRLIIRSTPYQFAGRHLNTLQDLCFESLQTLTINGLVENLSRLHLSSLHLPQLTELFILTHGDLSISDLYAPKIKDVTISVAQILMFKCNTFTSIESFDIECISPNPFPFPEDIDFTSLCSLKNLIATPLTADHVLPFTKGISKLTISHRIPDLSQCPHLTHITLYHAQGRGLKQLKNIKSLKSLVFFSATKILFIDYIFQLCPQLEELVVRNSPFRKCLNITARNLKKLELTDMTAEDSLNFSFKGCVFPLLESLSVAVIEVESPSRWGITAPELRKLVLRTSSKELNLGSFSKLNKLEVGGAVEVIKAVRCTNLASVDVLFARRLQTVEVASKDNIQIKQSELNQTLKVTSLS